MRILVRILAVAAAVIAYLLLGRLVGIGLLLLAAIFGWDVPGYHEPGSYAWWAWPLAAVWYGGLVAVAWWVGFRAPWWRRAAPEDTRTGGG